MNFRCYGALIFSQLQSTEELKYCVKLLNIFNLISSRPVHIMLSIVNTGWPEHFSINNL